MSEFGQKRGGKLACDGASSSHPQQTRVDGQDWQRRNAVAYRKLNRGTTPSPGSMPRRSIILQMLVVQLAGVVDPNMMFLHRRPGSVTLPRDPIGALDLGQGDFILRGVERPLQAVGHYGRMRLRVTAVLPLLAPADHDLARFNCATSAAAPQTV
jgi:hypothetical protein